MKFKIVHNKVFPFGKYKGIVIWPFMFLKPTGTEESDLKLYKHELIHCYQYKKYGIFKFFIKYLMYRIRYGYKNHPMEVEAYQKQNEPLTEKELTWYFKERIEL